MSQDDTPISRLKWGTASLIVRASLTPIVLPIVHHGFQKVTSQFFFSLSIILGFVPCNDIAFSYLVFFTREKY